MQRSAIMLIVAAVLASARPVASQDKTPTADALASLPKNGWVTEGKVKVKPWYAEEAEYRLVMKFVPDKDADGKVLRKGKVTLGFDLSKDGQAEVILQPAEGQYELPGSSRAGPAMWIVREGQFPLKNNAFQKAAAVYKSTNIYEIKEGKLVFGYGLTVDAWGALPAHVKHKGTLTFVAK